MSDRRLLIAAPASGNGKTTITLALMALMTANGTRVQGFKVGPDYIDPSFHQLITGRPSYNLDVWMGGEEDIRKTFFQHSQDADISLIEGVMGLLDGVSSNANWGSSAHVAHLLNCPVVLVMDIHAMARSAAAIVKGFQALSGDTAVAGVILNRAGSVAHATMVQSAIEQETGVPVLGFLLHDASVQLPERHLGLVTAAETQDQSRPKLEALGRLLADHLDLDRLWRVAMVDGDVKISKGRQPRVHFKSRPRVAVAFDRAFNFYYPANLDLLTAMGAELLWFRPTEGEHIPARATHLYWGGGFPEEYVHLLAQQTAMMGAMRERIAADGLSTLAECGGYMFLGEALWVNGERFPMVGAIPMETEMTASLQEIGYRELTVLANSIFPVDSRFRGHAYHHSKIRRSTGMNPAYAVSSARGSVGLEGYRSQTLLAGYSHLYFPSQPEAVEAWLTQRMD
ncbi:MAG: cobyrinic acid a,c-diamide synthase [Sulfobacillus acidophilus]|uniref:Cobyrinate a,c-diamide synthase n=1 Tax=Sulfobacillus acidophilus TaxID=53633 RepID=A0A2T2WH03_9FIRM|nr:MAG: cobyrinic acid a,c-diamide synthase [Sulfobacillus acidophilus]